MSCAVGNWGFACCCDRSTAVRCLTWNISISAPIVVPSSIYPLGMKLVFSSVFTECQQWCLSPGLVTMSWHATGINWACGGLKEASVFQRKSRVWSSACGGFSEPRTSTEKWLQLVGTGLDSSQPEFQARASLGRLDTGCGGSGGQRGRGIPPHTFFCHALVTQVTPPPDGAGPSEHQGTALRRRLHAEVGVQRSNISDITWLLCRTLGCCSVTDHWLRIFPPQFLHSHPVLPNLLIFLHS